MSSSSPLSVVLVLSALCSLFCLLIGGVSGAAQWALLSRPVRVELSHLLHGGRIMPEVEIKVLTRGYARVPVTWC